MNNVFFFCTFFIICKYDMPTSVRFKSMGCQTLLNTQCVKLNFWSTCLQTSVPYVLNKIPLTQANFLLAQLKIHSHWRALVSLTVTVAVFNCTPAVHQPVRSPWLRPALTRVDSHVSLLYILNTQLFLNLDRLGVWGSSTQQPDLCIGLTWPCSGSPCSSCHYWYCCK